MTVSAPGPEEKDGGLISGRFALGELLGSGGSASVFVASDVVAPGVPVALKVLHPHLSVAEASRTAFFAEARAAGRVQHPNVVRVLATGVHDGAGERRAWIAFERAPGITLGELVASRGRLTPADALAVTDGILRGLEAVHAAGVVHRDLAPSNISVAPRAAGGGGAGGGIRADDVRVLDFGLADAPGRPALGRDILRSAADPSRADAVAPGVPEPPLGVLGSVNYLSPEHALGRPVDERGDLYQAAALLHFMVTGRPPFVRSSLAEVMAAHAAATPPVPSVSVPGIPSSVDRIVVRGLLKRPDARFASAAEMREAVVAAAAALERRQPEVAPTRVLPTASAPAATGVTAVADSDARPRRTVATILALAVVALATIWLVAAGSVPRTVPASTAAPPTATTPSPTTVPTAAPTQQAAATVLVPGLVGLTRDAAEQRAREAGLVVGAVTQRDGTQHQGLVIASTPPPGARIAGGSSVTLVVASGSNAVPAVAGASGVEAGSAITSAGFKPGERIVIDSTVPDGTVLGTEPAAGVSVPLGSTVVIVIARGPDPTPPPDSTPGPTPTPDPSIPPPTGPTRP